MRKFKFMSKAVVGMMAVAMTMGSLSGVTVMQPIAVYAAEGDLTATLSKTKVPQGKDSGTEITFTVTKEGTDGDYDGAKITAVSEKDGGAASDITISQDGKKITVTSAAAAGMYTVTITDDTDATKTATADFVVVAQSFIVTADKTEATAGETTEITFQAGQGIEGEVVTESAKAVTYTMDYTAAEGDTVTKITGSKLTIGPDVPANTDITVTATEADTDATNTVKISVKTKSEDKPGTDGLQVTEINYDKFNVTIKDSAAKYAFLEVWKFGDKESTGFGNDKDKKSADYSYELTNGEITVDLSFLKLGKTAQGIKIYTDAHTTPVEKVIKAQPGKIKLKWDGKKAADFDYSKSFDEKGTAFTAAVLKSALYEYKGQYDKEWISMADFDKVNHISAGSNIIVRQAATATDPAGPEVKVKIASLPKAPKVTIDYKKNTIKITNKMQYAYSTKPQDWAEGPQKGFSIDVLRKGANAQATDEVVVFVRTAGGGNKLDSNVTSVVLPPLATITDNKTDTITVGDKSLKYEKAEIGRDKAKGYKLTGTGFESTTDDPSKESRTWKAISSKGLEVKSGDTVYIRLAGAKGSKNAKDSFASAELEWKAPAAEAEADIAITVEADGTDNPTDLKAGALAAEKTFKFKATAKKGSETVTEGIDYTWKVKDPDGKELKETDGFTWTGATLKIAAQTKLVAGTYTVHAECGTATVTPAQIVVEADIDTIEVSDADGATNPTNLTAGALTSQQVFKFEAVAKKSNAVVTEGVTFTWTIKDPDGTVLTTEGGFTFNNAKAELTIATGTTLKAGNYTVSATCGSVTSATPLQITVN